MAALGDVSTTMQVTVFQYSLTVPIPAWPDVSTSMPADPNSTPPSGGGFPGYFSFG